MLKESKHKAQQAKFAVENEVAPLERIVERLEDEEEELRRQVVKQGRVDKLKKFLAQQQRLLQQEKDIKKQLKSKEQELSQIRGDMCNLDLEQLSPAERVNAKIYVKWKALLFKRLRVVIQQAASLLVT